MASAFFWTKYNFRTRLFFPAIVFKIILTYLHRDASKNIVFCFTNARNTPYKSDDSLSRLKTLLGEKVDINLIQNNVFCVDNEAFRFLCAQREGISFDVNDMMNFIDSWGKSAAETNRMIDCVAGLHPHSLAHTLSLNNLREYVVSLKETYDQNSRLHPGKHVTLSRSKIKRKRITHILQGTSRGQRDQSLFSVWWPSALLTHVWKVHSMRESYFSRQIKTWTAVIPATFPAHVRLPPRTTAKE